MDDNLRLPQPQAAQYLQEQNARLQLLLKLTTSITADLTLKEVLRVVSANIREVMRCDGASVTLPTAEPGTLRRYAVAFPAARVSPRKNRSSLRRKATQQGGRLRR